LKKDLSINTIYLGEQSRTVKFRWLNTADVPGLYKWRLIKIFKALPLIWASERLEFKYLFKPVEAAPHIPSYYMKKLKYTRAVLFY
jgi:hypothetical protein